MRLPPHTRVPAWLGRVIGPARRDASLDDVGKRAATGLSSARERFERRAIAARRRPWLLAGAAALVAVVLAGLVWLGWFSSVLTATSIRVEGASTQEAREARAVAGVELGQPLMRVDTAAVTERLVEHRAWSAVTVSRSLPHTVVIEVTPRTPVLALERPQGQVELVDAEGVFFREVDEAPEGVPVVQAEGPEVTTVGVQAALGALFGLDASTRKGVSAMTVDAADQVTFTLTLNESRRTVRWGGMGDEALKARLVQVLAGEPGSTIDVSVPSSPVTR